jgi:cytochrome c peroxidase
MHDGRFDTLREVVEHYNSGVQPHPNLDRGLGGRNRRPRRLNLNDREIEALVAFMNALTDQTFLSDPKFSNPFED